MLFVPLSYVLIHSTGTKHSSKVLFPVIATSIFPKAKCIVHHCWTKYHIDCQCFKGLPHFLMFVGHGWGVRSESPHTAIIWIMQLIQPSVFHFEEMNFRGTCVYWTKARTHRHPVITDRHWWGPTKTGPIPPSPWATKCNQRFLELILSLPGKDVTPQELRYSKASSDIAQGGSMPDLFTFLCFPWRDMQLELWTSYIKQG